MSIINLTFRTAFENTIMSASNCIIPQDRRLSTRSIRNRTDISDAVKEVYFHRNTLWAHARGGKGKNKLTNSGERRPAVENILTNIGGQIYEYFNGKANVANTQENFDAFHKSLCHYFLTSINAIRAEVNYAPMSYGQAQKLINLSFKYISCFSDYCQFADLFTHCHIVIDNVVLTNLKSSKLSIMFGCPIPSKIQGLSGGTFNGHGWTDFSEEDYNNLKDEFRRVISPYLGNLTYLELEYSMWPVIGPVDTHGTMPTAIPSFFM